MFSFKPSKKYSKIRKQMLATTARLTAKTGVRHCGTLSSSKGRHSLFFYASSAFESTFPVRTSCTEGEKKKNNPLEDLISHCQSKTSLWGRLRGSWEMLQSFCPPGNERGTSKLMESLAFKVNGAQLDQVLANPASWSKQLKDKGGDCCWPPSSTYSGWEVAAGFKLLQQAREDKGAEEEDAAPQEDIRHVGAVVPTGSSLELSVQILTFLEKQSVRTQRQCTCSKETSDNCGVFRISVQDP